MKRLFRLAVRLYPSWWRRRYGREFEALLEDVRPGWRELVDILNGAFTMQIKTVASVPVACAVAGALVGGIVVMQTPELYASSATIRLQARDAANGKSAIAGELRASLERALGSSDARPATSVVMSRWDAGTTTLILTSRDSDPAQAQRVVEKLTAAIGRDLPAASEVISGPGLPTAPIPPDYLTPVGSGAGIGLLAGGLVLLLRSRRRPASAG